jgi:hypothetical protein
VGSHKLLRDGQGEGAAGNGALLHQGRAGLAKENRTHNAWTCLMETEEWRRIANVCASSDFSVPS